MLLVLVSVWALQLPLVVEHESPRVVALALSPFLALFPWALAWAQQVLQVVARPELRLV